MTTSRSPIGPLSAATAAAIFLVSPPALAHCEMSLLPFVWLFVGLVVFFIGAPLLFVYMAAPRRLTFVPVALVSLGLCALAWRLSPEHVELVALIALAATALLGLAFARVREGERPRARLALSTLALSGWWGVALFFAAAPPPFAASLAGWDYDHPACTAPRTAPPDRCEAPVASPARRWARTAELIRAGADEESVALASDPSNADADGVGQVPITSLAEGSDVAWFCTAYLRDAREQRPYGCTFLRLSSPLGASGVPSIEASRRFDFHPVRVERLGDRLIIGAAKEGGKLLVLDAELRTIAERGRLGDDAQPERQPPELLIGPGGDLFGIARGLGQLTIRRLGPDLRDLAPPRTVPAPLGNDGTRQYFERGILCREEHTSGAWMGLAVDLDLRPRAATPWQRLLRRLRGSRSILTALPVVGIAFAILLRRERSALRYGAWLVIAWLASLVPITAWLAWHAG